MSGSMQMQQSLGRYNICGCFVHQTSQEQAKSADKLLPLDKLTRSTSCPEGDLSLTQ